MAETLREFVTKWGFEVDDGPLKKLEASVDGVLGSLKIAGAAAIAASVAIYGVVKSFADEGDAIDKASTRMGINTDALQKLQYAAYKADMSNEDLEGGLIKLQKAAYDAATGNEEALKTFKGLGVSVKDASGKIKNSEQLLYDVSNGLSEVKDQTKKTAVALDIFGRGGKNFLDLTKNGAKGLHDMGDEYERLGGLISKDGVAQSARFHDSLETLGVVLKGIRNVVAESLLPAMTPVIEKFNEFVAANKEAIGQKTAEYFELAVQYVMAFAKALSNMITFVIGLIDSLGGLDNVLRFLIGGVKILAVVFTFLVGIKMVMWLAAVGLAIKALIVALLEMGVAGVVATGGLALIPIAILAILAAIYLLVDDIMAFSEGRDSIFGTLINFFKEAFPNLTKFLSGGFDIIKEVILSIGSAIGMVFDGFVKVFGYVRDFLKPLFESIGDVIGGWWKSIKSFFNSIGESLGAVGDELSGTARVVAARRADREAGRPLTAWNADPAKLGSAGLAFGPLAPDASGNYPSKVPTNNSVASSNTNVQVSAPITVVAAPGQSPDDIAAAVSGKFTGDSFQQMLRETSRSTAPMVER